MVKNLLSFFIIFLTGFVGYSQSFEWSNVVYGDFSNTGYCCAADNDGNYYFAGKFNGNVQFGAFELTADEQDDSMFLLKTNSAGEIVWVKDAKQVEPTKDIIPYDMRVDENNNIYVVGRYCHQTRFSDDVVLDGFVEADGETDLDCFVAKYEPDGALAWVKGYYGPGKDQFEAIALEGSTLYVGGKFAGTLSVEGTEIKSEYPEVGNHSNPFIMSLSTNDGSVNWINILHCSSGFCRELAVENNQLYYTVEASENIWMQQVGAQERNLMKKSTGSYDVHVGKLNATTGAFVWDNLIGCAGFVQNYCLDVRDGKVVAGGNYKGEVTFESQNNELIQKPAVGSTDTYFCQYDIDGNLGWVYTLGGEKVDITNGDVVIDSQGNVFATGYYMSPSMIVGTKTITANTTEAYLLKLNSLGEFQSIDQTTGERTYIHSLAEAPNGDIVFTAATTDECTFLSKDFQLSEEQITDGTEQLIFGVITEKNTAVDSMPLADVNIFPNPTSDIIHVTADFSIESLQLFDPLGKMVSSSQTNQLDLSILNKGMYLLKIEGGSGVMVRKVIRD